METQKGRLKELGYSFMLVGTWYSEWHHRTYANGPRFAYGIDASSSRNKLEHKANVLNELDATIGRHYYVVRL